MVPQHSRLERNRHIAGNRFVEVRSFGPMKRTLDGSRGGGAVEAANVSSGNSR